MSIVTRLPLEWAKCIGGRVSVGWDNIKECRWLVEMKAWKEAWKASPATQFWFIWTIRYQLSDLVSDSLSDAIASKGPSRFGSQDLCRT